MKYLKHYEELNLRNIFKRKSKDDSGSKEKTIPFEELKKFTHEYIDDWKEGENGDVAVQ